MKFACSMGFWLWWIEWCDCHLVTSPEVNMHNWMLTFVGGNPVYRWFGSRSRIFHHFQSFRRPEASSWAIYSLLGIT